MLVEITEGLGFSAAHLLIEHEKCEHLHGHNYRVTVAVEGDPDTRGLVVDFLKIKRLLKQMFKNYDHRLLLPAKNPALKRLSKGKGTRISVQGREFGFPSEDVVWLPVVNTTVEELARIIADELKKNLAHPNLRWIRVRVEESPGQSAMDERKVGPDSRR